MVDEDFRMRAGKALYDENLRLLVEKVKENTRAIWRVCMDDKGIIIHMIRCRKIERPKPNSFLFITNDNCKPPKFGSFNGLGGFQVNIAEILQEDIGKLLNANELAFCLSQAPTLKTCDVVDGIDELSCRFGELPTPALKKVYQEKEMQEVDQKNKETEKSHVLNNVIAEDVFEDYLQKEKKKQRKRQRQRKKKGKTKQPAPAQEAQTTEGNKLNINFDPELFKRLNQNKFKDKDSAE